MSENEFDFEAAELCGENHDPTLIRFARKCMDAGYQKADGAIRASVNGIGELDQALAEARAEAERLRSAVTVLSEHREAYNEALMDFDPVYAGHNYLLAAIDVIRRAKEAEAAIETGRPIPDAALAATPAKGEEGK